MATAFAQAITGTNEKNLASQFYATVATILADNLVAVNKQTKTH